MHTKPPCQNCPPAPDTGWRTCSNPSCKSLYSDYVGMFHTSLCPRCSDQRKLAERMDRATNERFAAFRTNAPEGA